MNPPRPTELYLTASGPYHKVTMEGKPKGGIYYLISGDQTSGKHQNKGRRAT
jgi:hypothetical protein